MSDQNELTPSKIKELRKEKKLTQEALAKLLGVSTSTVIRWEKGDAEPSGTSAAVLLAMIAGPALATAGLGAFMSLGSWAFAAYGIYRQLKDVFEPASDTSAREGDKSQ